MKEGKSNSHQRATGLPPQPSSRHKLEKIQLEETLEDWQFNSNTKSASKSSKEGLDSKDLPSMDDIISSLEEILDEQVMEDDAMPPVLKGQRMWDEEEMEAKPVDPGEDTTLNLCTADKVEEEAMDLSGLEEPDQAMDLSGLEEADEAMDLSGLEEFDDAINLAGMEEADEEAVDLAGMEEADEEAVDLAGMEEADEDAVDLAGMEEGEEALDLAGMEEAIESALAEDDQLSQSIESALAGEEGMDQTLVTAMTAKDEPLLEEEEEEEPFLAEEDDSVQANASLEEAMDFPMSDAPMPGLEDESCDLSSLATLDHHAEMALSGMDEVALSEEEDGLALLGMDSSFAPGLLDAESEDGEESKLPEPVVTTLVKQMEALPVAQVAPEPPPATEPPSLYDPAVLQDVFGRHVEEIARDMLRESLALLLPDLIEKAIRDEIQRLKTGP